MASLLSNESNDRREEVSRFPGRPRGSAIAARGAALLLALVVAAIVYVWPRTLDLDRVVTVDEPVFLGMSANFANAIAHGQYAKTDQFLYPAVPIMWAGAAGFLVSLPNYVRDHPEQIEPPDDFVLTTVDGPIRAAGGDPLAVLVAARAAKIALQAVVYLIALWLLWRLFGLAVTALAAAFISFDPFLIAHDQLLHVDGFTGITAFAAMLAIADADRERTRSARWALAGALAAVCWLTRLTGLVLLPIMLLVIAFGAISRRGLGAQHWKAAARAAGKQAGVALAASLATTFALWPALWVAPIATLGATLGAWRQAATTPHPYGLYFAGKTIAGDPGPLFYVFVALYKITPFTLVGVAIFAIAVLGRIAAIVPARARRSIGVLSIFVAVYSIGMAVGMRKFDRYILPDFLFFDLFAAIGIVGATRLLWPRRGVPRRVIAGAAVASLVIGQVALAVAQRPYFLAYDNPLFGGARAADQILMLGWGEGIDQAARYIRSQPGGDAAVVRTSIQPTVLHYFFPPTVTTGSLAMEANAEGRQEWAETDYAVTYILEWNRNTFGGVVPYLARFTPIYTVRIDGVEVARVYDLRRIPPPEWMLEPGNDGRSAVTGARQPRRLAASPTAGGLTKGHAS